MAEAVVTLTAKNKLMRARAGEINLPKIVGMAFGSGGVDASSSVLVPGPEQTSLNNELLRKEIDKYTIISNSKCRYECTLTNDELNREYISEVALYDADGDLVAIKNFLPKGKDENLEMTIQIDDEF